MLDNHTIQACIKGDQRTHRKVYETCAPYVFAIVKNYFNTDDDRKDAMQEVFASLFTSLKNFDKTKGVFKSWLSRLVVYQCISLIKKSNNLQVTYAAEIEDQIPDTTLLYLEQFSTQDLDKMLALMPQGYKTIFLLSVIEEYSHKEIGELLGITPETSRSQLFRGIKWIKNNIFTDAKMVQYGLQ